MNTSLSTCRTRSQAGYVNRVFVGTSQLRPGLTTTASLTGTVQPGPGDVSRSASSGFALFCAALAFAVWGVMTLGLSFVALGVIGVITLCETAWRAARRAWGAHYICAWCKGSISGNPFAKKSHGICNTCCEIEKSKMANARADSLRRPLAMIALLAIFTLTASADSRLSTLDSRLAVRAIVGESANQGRDGMLAVAGAIRNRGTLRGVYGVKNPIADKQPAYVWQRAQLAWAMSATNDISRGATHWENIGAFGEPRWAKSLTVTTNIGSHTFYK